MDAKITLSFNEEVILKAKQFAEKNNISLLRLMEPVLRKITSGDYKNLEELPVSEWVNMVSEVPLFTYSSRVLSLSDYSGFDLYIPSASPLLFIFQKLMF